MAPEGSDAISVAAEALEGMDDRQLQQILLLASDDQLFQWKTMHDPAGAVMERGYHLTPDGIAKLEFLLRQRTMQPLRDFASHPIRLYN